MAGTPDTELVGQRIKRTCRHFIFDACVCDTTWTETEQKRAGGVVLFRRKIFTKYMEVLTTFKTTSGFPKQGLAGVKKANLKL